MMAVTAKSPPCAPWPATRPRFSSLACRRGAMVGRRSMVAKSARGKGLRACRHGALTLRMSSDWDWEDRDGPAVTESGEPDDDDGPYERRRGYPVVATGARAPEELEGQRRWARFWGAVEVSSLLGAVGGSAAALVTEQVLFASAPLLMPLVILLASRQKESALKKIDDQKQKVLWSEMGRLSQLVDQQLQRQGPAGLEVIDAISVELEPLKRLEGLEDRLGEIGERVESTSRNTREVGGMAGKMAREAVEARKAAVGQLRAAVAEIRRDVSGMLRTELSEATNLQGAGRLETRLASLEGAIADMEVGNTEAQRRLAVALQGALADQESAVLSAIRSEVSAAMEPVGRLPQLLAEAMPRPASRSLAGDGPIVDVPAPVELTERQIERLRAALADDLARMSDDLGDQMSAVCAAVRRMEEQPVQLGKEQWSALGQRLTAIQSDLTAVSESSSALSDAAGSISQRLENAPSAPEAAAAAAAAQAAALAEQLRPLQDLPDRIKEQAASGGSSAARDAAQAVVEEAGLGALSKLPSRVEEALLAAQKEAADAQGREQLAAASLGPMRESLEEAVDRLGQVLGRVEALEAAGASGEGGEGEGAGVTRDELASQLRPLAESIVGVTAELARVAAPAPPPVPQGQPLAAGGKAEEDDDGEGQRQGAEEGGVKEAVEGDGEGQDSAGAAAVAASPGAQESSREAAFEAMQRKLRPVRGAEEAEEAAPLQPPSPGGGGGGRGGGGRAPHVVSRRRADDDAEAGPQLPDTQGDREALLETSVSPTGGEDSLATATEGEGGAVQGGASPETAPEDDDARKGEAERLVKLGLEQLRTGRELARGGEQLGAADAALRSAAGYFEAATQEDPRSMQAQGNWGNTLLTHGQLKIRLLEAVRAGAAEVGAGPDAAEAQLLEEAEDLLVMAGRRFKALLAINAQDERALVNWGGALCLRAKLLPPESADQAEALYAAAVEKFRVALEIDPAMVPALRSWGLALRDLASQCQAPGGTAAAQTLEQACLLLEEALRIRPDDAACRRALESCEAELAYG